MEVRGLKTIQCHFIVPSEYPLGKTRGPRLGWQIQIAGLPQTSGFVPYVEKPSQVPFHFSCALSTHVFHEDDVESTVAATV